jgi:hypothetical protein
VHFLELFLVIRIEAAPAVFVVPANDRILKANLFEPRTELVFRNVVSNRGDEVIEDDVMQFFKIVARQIAQIILIEQMRQAWIALGKPAPREKDKFTCKIQRHCQNSGKNHQDLWVEFARNRFS